MTELLPCPFCGNTARLIRDLDKEANRTLRVSCQGCGSQGPTMTLIYGSASKADCIAYVIKLWNTRTRNLK